MLHRILALIWKELLMVLKDKRTRISILLPPVIQLVIFTFSATLDVKNVPIGILNRDNGEKGFELVQRFHGAKVFNKIIYLKDVKEIKPFIDNQKGIMVVSLDEQFSRNIDSSNPSTVQLILDGRKSNSAQIVAGYANTILAQFNKEHAQRKDLKKQNVALIDRVWFNPNILFYWYNIPSLVATLSMLACLIVTTSAVARERELGTFDQLLVSPLSPFEILAGKTIPGILIGMLEGSLLLAVGVLGFEVPFTGSLALFYLSQFIFVFSISGIGLSISSISKTQQQAMLGTFVFMIPSVLLSGFATPIENMPTWLQPVTNFIPLKYMMVISKGIFLKAMPSSIVLQNLWPMIPIGAFNLILASVFFKRRLQ